MYRVDYIAYAMPISLLLVLYIFVKHLKSINYSPARVLLALWIFIFLFHGLTSATQYIPLYPLGFRGGMLITLSVICLAVSFVFWRFIFDSYSRKIEFTSRIADRAIVRATLPRIFVLSVALLGTFTIVAMYLTAVSIVGTYDILSSMQKLRNQIIYSGRDFGFLEYFSTLLQVSAVYIYIISRSDPRIGKILPIYLVLTAMISAFLLTQRTSMFMILIAVAFSTRGGKAPSLKTLTLLASGLLCLFVAMGFSTGKIGSSQGGLSFLLMSSQEKLLVYLLTPVSAFDQSAIWNFDQQAGSYSLRFFQAIAVKTGIASLDLQPLIMKFIAVPALTNVYTFAYVPIHDFGMAFPIYYFVIGGVLAFVLALRPSAPAIQALQGFAYYPILLSFYQDQIVTLTSTWIQIGIILFVLHRITKFHYVLENKVVTSSKFSKQPSHTEASPVFSK
jgi:oligosaccharide repeat unit polymerase